MVSRCFFIILFLFCVKSYAEIPVEDFAGLAKFSEPKLSPDATKMAAYLTRGGETYLYLMDFNPSESPTLTPTRSMSKSDDIFFQSYMWANEDVLVAKIRMSVKWYANLLNVTRILLVPADAKIKSDYISVDRNDWGRPKQHSKFIHRLPEDPEHILVSVDEDFDALFLAPEVDIVNVYTGKKRRVQRNVRRIFEWISDSQGNLRVGVAYRDVEKDTDQVVYYREPGGNLSPLLKNNYFDSEKLDPVRFEKGNDDILLMRKENEDDSGWNTELVRFDTKLKKIVGVYENKRRQSILKQVEEEMPEFDVEIVSTSYNENRYVFKFSSDTHPSIYLYYDVTTGVNERLPSPYPQLEGQTFSKMQHVSYEARDGLTIPAFLTVPHDKKPEKLPTIIYPHGGPWSHDEWGFDTRVQFFADRGYAVFQPQFRGSTGYGIAHEQAGYQQWGLAIQDDITDGVKWLIDEGIADPEKICIVGASFGGYAAALGLATTPELYRCGISIAGVLDFKQYIKDLSGYYFSGINKTLTNEKKDSKLVSPYHLVDRINAPLLLIHGTRDTVVPFDHSKKMAKALKKRKKEYKFVELKGAEHWTTSDKHELTKLKAIEKFLAEHLN